ncbi:protein kinase domain-containing protein [Sorangium sp. So ce693]|uniref:serine/threonine-protein kinase n=1 Tax=Sorangium sp. So ce693 TaxID=3133318 RepID=UPI003F5EEA2A
MGAGRSRYDKVGRDEAERDTVKAPGEMEQIAKRMHSAIEATADRSQSAGSGRAFRREIPGPMVVTAVGEGRFRIERRVGAGGMGTVYQAFDRRMQVPVAVKLLTDRAPSDIARFLREAQVLSKIKDPAVVRYVAHGDDPVPYLVMEWLNGHDLAAQLARKPPSIAESVALIKHVACALTSVHAQGIVHRDLKPSNLFLIDGRLDRIKIIDFGIARALHATRVLTAKDTVIGTPEYMAPEQARASCAVDVRADVFSLGCVLFECLAGRRPFTGMNFMAVLAQVLLDDAPRLSDLCRGVPDALVDLVDRMLCKDPSGRPANAAALAAELDGLDLELVTPKRPAATPVSLSAEEDRLISVLIVGAIECDATGSTVRSDVEHDEDNADRIAEAVSLAVMQAAYRYNGRVECLIDGTTVVTFRADGLITDHAERAARCALEVHRRVRRHPLALATGWQRAGQPSPIGRLVEKSISLLLGSQGTLQIDGLTAGLLDRGFEMESSEEGYILKRELELAGEARKVLGKVVPFVGRDREIALLQRTLDPADPGARAVLVIGEPGAGKSRLRHELVHWIRGRSEPVTIWSARGNPMRAAAPFGLLGDLVRQAAEIQTGEALAVRREKLATRVARNVGAAHATRVTEFLGELAGTPFLAAHRDELRAARNDKALMADHLRRAWVDFLEAECRVRPVLIIIDDLQWGDPATIEYIDVALRRLKKQPLWVLALARPEASALFPELWRARGLLEIHLDGLSRKVCDLLCRHLLGEDEPADVVERLWERSGGNPFLLEELLRARRAGGVEDLPETALAIVQSRLSLLEPESRRLLRAASVLGKVFWRGGLLQLLGAETRAADVDARLAELEEREWILKHNESSRTGEVEYSFLHDAMRDGAYAMLTEHDRRRGHALAGAWLENSGETDAILLAQHFDAAGMPAQAASYFRRAGEQAVAQWAHQEAIVHLSRALELAALVPEPGERAKLELDLRVAIAVPLAPALGYSAPEVRQAFARAYELCSEVRAAPQNFATLCGLWRASLWRTKLDAGMELGEQLLALATGAREPAMEIAAHRCIGAIYFYMGQFDQAIEHHLRVLAAGDDASVMRGAAQSFELVDPVVGSLSYMAFLDLLRGRPDGAVRRSEAAVARARGMKHAFSVTFSLSFATWFHQFRHDAEKTREYATEAIRACTELGHQMWLAWNRVPLGWALCEEGRAAEGRRLIEQTIEEGTSAESSLGLSYFLTLLAEAELLTGKNDAASAALDKAEQFAARSNEGFYLPEIHRMRGVVSHAAGATHDAALAIDRALRTARSLACPLFFERAARTAAHLGLEGELEDVDREREA